MRRLLPRTLVGQTVLVLLIGLTVSHVLSMAIYSTERIDVLTLTGGQQFARQAAEIVRVLDETPGEWRTRIVDAVNGPHLRVEVTPESRLVRGTEEDWRSALIRGSLERLTGREGGGRVFVQLFDDPALAEACTTSGQCNWMALHMARYMGGPATGQSLRAAIRLADRGWVNFATVIPESPPLLSTRAILSMVLMAATVVLFSLWVVRRLTNPLRLLARAAEALGRDVAAPPVPESGPTEVRRASRAFNDMQRRLRRLIENRTRMLAAISHDLRTPITQLRLRAEFIEDADEQRKTMATLDEMETMIASTLAFARDDAATEERRVVDLAALVASVCDDLADAGFGVAFEAPGKTPYACAAGALKRALRNLVENAVKYGGRARVALDSTDRVLRIVIDDDGPGIPADEIENAFQPFYRIESSRNPETGGVGLGLSVARTVVHAHGGEIILANRAEGGLRATIEVPR